MKQTLDDFILEWNKSHDRFFFSLQKAPVADRPIEIGIRYSAVKHEKYLSIKQWDRLGAVVEMKSSGTMYVVSDEKLFSSGIINIAVASANHNYQERIVIGILEWICKDFFSIEDKND